MISFSESLLHDLLKTLDLPEGSTVSLVRDDGKLMARSPSAAEEDVDAGIFSDPRIRRVPGATRSMLDRLRARDAEERPEGTRRRR